MITRGVRLQLVAFLVISMLGIVYTGLNFVGLHVGRSSYRVTVLLPSSGGIFSNAEVDERGVPVGRVGALHLTPDGVAVDLNIDRGRRIPAAGIQAAVANLSAVGEQYVQLLPQSDTGPYLQNHSVIPMSATSVPIDDATLLQNLDDLVNSVDKTHLAEVIRELGKSFDNTGPDLQRLVDRGNSLLAAAQAALPQTLRLADDGRTVLDTQRAVAGDLRSFAANLNLLSQQLVVSDPDLRALFDNGVTSAQQLRGLLSDNAGDLPVVLANLVTLGQISAARLPGLEQTLILYPLNVANAFLNTTGRVAHFGAVNTSTPPDCTTGYQSTTARPNTGSGQNTPANLNTLCEPPNQAPVGPSEARGAALAPRPTDDNTGVRGGAVGTTSNPNKPNYATFFAGFDTSTRTFTAPNGRPYQLGDNGATATAFGEQSWEWLMVSAATS